jgi:DNA-binding response OmpR family regulator
VVVNTSMQERSRLGRILIVDDDPHVGEILSQYLGDEGYEVESAVDAKSALRAIAAKEPALVILDVRLPDQSGLEALAAMRSQGSAAPVIMLTGLADELDRVLGLELGADDYVTKPFSAREVLARIRTVLRRTRGGTSSGEQSIAAGEIEIDPAAQEARVAGEMVPLTRTEFRILAVLARHPGRTFERNQLLEAIGADVDVLDRTLDKHVTNLRRKLNLHGAPDGSIVTVHGVGYKLARDPQRAAARAQ